ncbi:MAG TPA: hypothetical protein VJ728_16065 [Candidatus Binataceae bacterium]|nr:hypothetical protein [Candidatus Binataceae bacterium]
MKPVRVKYGGLFRITRRTFLVLQFILLLICIAMMVVGMSVMLRTGRYYPHLPDKSVQDDLIYEGLLALFWLGVLILVAGGIETIVMLRKFRRAAAEQRAGLASVETVEPVPAAPSAPSAPLPPSEPPNTNIQP